MSVFQLGRQRVQWVLEGQSGVILGGSEFTYIRAVWIVLGYQNLLNKKNLFTVIGNVLLDSAH